MRTPHVLTFLGQLALANLKPAIEVGMAMPGAIGYDWGGRPFAHAEEVAIMTLKGRCNPGQKI